MQGKSGDQKTSIDTLIQRYKAGEKLSPCEFYRVCQEKHRLKGKFRQKIEMDCLDPGLKKKDRQALLHGMRKG